METSGEIIEKSKPDSTGVKSPTPAQMLCMARGFSIIFWGLLTTLILFFAKASFEIFETIKIPAYVTGSALVAWGLFVLHDTGPISSAWHRRAKTALFLILSQIYFAPFLIWWRASPDISFLLINWLCMLFSGMLGLFYINLLVAESARALNNQNGRFEACLFAASVFFLMIIPFLIWATMAIIAAIKNHTSLYFEIWHATNNLPIWAYALITMPCSLTLLASWKARDRCYNFFLNTE